MFLFLALLTEKQMGKIESDLVKITAATIKPVEQPA